MTFVISTIIPILLIVIGALGVVFGVKDIFSAAYFSSHPMKKLLRQSVGLRAARGFIFVFLGGILLLVGLVFMGLLT